MITNKNIKFLARFGSAKTLDKVIDHENFSESTSTGLGYLIFGSDSGAGQLI